MQTPHHAVRAYAASAAYRSLREQEADLFRRVNAGLKRARESAGIARVRALADNDRLWLTVIDLMRDPANALPLGIRGQIISVGLTVQREMQRDAPNFDFLIEVNDNIAAGLAGQ